MDNVRKSVSFCGDDSDYVRKNSEKNFSGANKTRETLLVLPSPNRKKKKEKKKKKKKKQEELSPSCFVCTREILFGILNLT